MHTLSPHLEEKLHAIFMGSDINCGQWQCVLIFDHDTFNSVGATIRIATMGLFFSMHQCDRCSSDMTTWQSIIGRTWRSIQWLQRSRRSEGSSVRKYNVCFLFLRLHHFNASQTYLDHVHKSTEKHQELQLQLLKKKDQVLLYSLQPLAAPAQATRMHQLFKHLFKDHFSKSFLEHPKDQWPPFLLVVWCQVLKISSWKMIPFLNLCYYLYCLMTSTWRYRLL